MLEIRLFGRFEVRLNGKPVDIRSRPAQSLLAYLILTSGTSHRRERLAGLIWPDSTETNARNNLRQALWRLRKALRQDPNAGSQYILSDNITLTFKAEENFWADAIEFEQELPEDFTIDHLTQSITLYDGELLPGFYEDWVLPERERFLVIYEQKLQMLLDMLLAEGRWRDVFEWASRWIALGGAPEPAFRALMLAHGGLGDLSSVATAFQRCSDALEETLGVEPSEETKQIFRKLLHGEKPSILIPTVSERIPSPDLESLRTKTIPPPAFLMKGTKPIEPERKAFVARSEELSRITHFLKKSLVGQGQVVFVTGDAGSGKTALTHETARLAQVMDADLIVASGSCNALTGIVDPYHPFREVLGMMTSDLESKWEEGLIAHQNALRLWSSLPQTLQALIDYGPDLTDGFIQVSGLTAHTKAFGPNITEWMDELQRKRADRLAQYAGGDLGQKHLFDQYISVLQAISRNNPLVIILDDLQWADLGSISLLFEISRRIQGARILLVNVYRRDEVALGRDGSQHPLIKVLTEAKKTYGDIQIDLGDIDEAEGRAFVDAFLETESNRLDTHFREALFQQTRGHPLFTIELLRAMEERGDIVLDEDQQWVNTPLLDWDVLPAKIEGVIEERVGRLPENLREVLTVASVEGNIFTAEVIARVLDTDELEVVKILSRDLEKLHRLVSAQGIRRVSHQRISIYRFRHVLFQRHLYNQLDNIERAYLHESVGDVLETLFGDERGAIAVQLSRHYAEAGMAEKAIKYLQLAGDQAKRISANIEAIDHFSRGLDLLETLPKGPNRYQIELAIRLPMGVSLVATRGYADQEVENTFARARRLCRQIGDTPQLFPAHLGLWSYFTVRAKHRAARDLAEQLLQMAQSQGESSLQVEAHRAMGTTSFYLGDVKRARLHLEQGLSFYDPELHSDHIFIYGQDPGVSCLIHLGLSLFFLGYPDQANSKIREAITLAEKIAHPYTLAYALDMIAVFHSSRREAQFAQERAEAAIAISLEHGFPLWLATGKILRGWALTEQGFNHGIDLMHQGLRAWKEMGAELGRSYYLSLLAEAFERNGQIEKSLQTISDALASVEKNTERFNEAELYRLKGEFLYLQDEDHSEIEANLQKALHISQEKLAKLFELRATISLCRLWRDQDKWKKAQKMLSKIHQWFSEGIYTSDLIIAQELLEES